MKSGGRRRWSSNGALSDFDKLFIYVSVWQPLYAYVSLHVSLHIMAL